MKSKFEQFNDGVIGVYSINNDGKLESKLKEGETIRFGEENVSINRHFAAEMSDKRIDKVIHVPMRDIFDAHDVIVIVGEQYDVEKADQYKENSPPITKLSLTKYEKHREKEFA